jgi:hypothetical protein
MAAVVDPRGAFTGKMQEGRTRWSGLAALPMLSLAEDTRFELVRVLSQHAFQACALGH